MMVKNETVIISEDLLKLYSPISNNVGVEKVFPYVLLAQDFYVRPILGDALLGDLQIGVKSGQLSDNEKALVVKIAPMLANYTTYLALRSLAYSITEKGLTKENSENSSALDRTELGDMKVELKQTAEKCEELLVRYLCICRDTYTSWQPYEQCNCEKYDQKGGTTRTNKSIGIYLPKKKPTCTHGEKPTAPLWKEIAEMCEKSN